MTAIKFFHSFCLFFTFLSWEGGMLIAQTSQIQYYDFFTDSVLRINIVRTGNYHHAEMQIHSLVKEPFWSGIRTKTIEPFDYGTFKIHVYDSSSDQLIFTRSWSSLFSEYIFTEKGNTETKSFEEVVRMPFPRKTIKIVFFQRKSNEPLWQRQDSIMVNPHRTVFRTSSGNNKILVKKVFNAGKPQQVMDLVIVGDGYVESEKQKFLNDARRAAQYLLKCEPYSRFRRNISVWVVFIPIKSQDSMLCSFNTFGSERYIMTEKVFLLHDYLSQVPCDHVLILVDTSEYGGGGIYNFYATAPSHNTYTDFLIIHETGHSIGGLADEYWTSEVSVNNFYDLKYEPWEPNITTLVDFSKKWRHKLKPETPVPTPPTSQWINEVGVFEGGGYSREGIYRPSYECSMKSVRYNNFCPVCQDAIVKVIRYYTK